MVRQFQHDIMAVSNLLRHRVNGSEKLSVISKELPRRQAAVISIISEFQDTPIFQKDISKMLMIRRSSTTSILQDMEKSGLIERVPVGGDMRLKQLILTPKAVHYAMIIRAEFAIIEETVIKGFSEQEKATFHEFLERVKNNLTENRRQK